MTDIGAARKESSIIAIGSADTAIAAPA
jgi:hypothetical protein